LEHYEAKPNQHERMKDPIDRHDVFQATTAFDLEEFVLEAKANDEKYP